MDYADKYQTVNLLTYYITKFIKFTVGDTEYQDLIDEHKVKIETLADNLIKTGKYTCSALESYLISNLSTLESLNYIYSNFKELHYS